MSDILQKAEPLCNLSPSGGNFAGRYLDIARIVEGLVAEIKRLIAEVSDNQIILDCRKETIEELQEQLAAKDIELARWQKIAIEERAEVIQLNCILHKKDIIIKGDALRMAAKELSISDLSPKDCCP